MQTRRQFIQALGSSGAIVALPLRRARAASRRLRVLATTDRPIAEPLIRAFEQQYPDQAIDYVQVGSAEAYEGFVASNGQSADVLWSSAMDLQIKLVNDGLAQPYRSPHVEQLPPWAVWRHEAWATTWEPVGFAFDRRRLSTSEMPRTHDDLTALLRGDPARFGRRVASYDIERSGIGYMLAAQDAAAAPSAPALVQALGLCRASLHAMTQDMVNAITGGEVLIAHNALGSYVEAAMQQQPALGIIYPRDYTLIMSRVALISRSAREPEAARRWLDFLLSPRGQQLLGQMPGLQSVRLDAPATGSTAELRRQLGNAARPIPLGLGLLADLDRSKRTLLTRRWQRAFDAGELEALQLDADQREAGARGPVSGPGSGPSPDARRW